MIFFSNNVARRDKIAVFAISAFILGMVILRFSGTPNQYAVLYAFFENPGHFPNDIYLNNTFFFDSTYYFALNAFLGVDKNSITSFAWYLGISAVAIFYTYKIISRHFGLTNPVGVLLTLLFVSFLNHNFPVTTWGGIIPQAPGTATMFAKALGLMAIYYMLENRIWLSAAIITLTISLHILGDFILVPVLFFFVVLNREAPNKNLAALILPSAYLLYKTLSTSVDIAAGQETEHTYEAVMSMGGHDGDFLRQSIQGLILFIASFFVFFAFWRRLGAGDAVSPHLLPFLKAVFITSLLVAVCATLYTGFIYRLFLFPPVIMLAPVRAMNYYTLFFYLTAFVLIMQTTRLTSIEKASSLLALIVLHGGGLSGVVYPAVIVLGGFGVSRFFGNMLSRLKSAPALVPLSLALLIALASAQVVKGGVYKTSFDTVGWKHQKRWTGTIEADESVWNTFKKIQTMNADFVMLPIYRTWYGKLNAGNTFLNIIAEKSHFISDGHHFYFNGKLWQEHKVREKTVEEIVASIKNARPLSETARGVLQTRNVTIVVPKADSANLTGWTEKTVVDGFYMLRYSN